MSICRALFGVSDKGGGCDAYQDASLFGLMNFAHFAL